MGYGFSDRGFLSLPFCTIYGSSILAIYLIIGTPSKGRLEPLFLRAKKLPSTHRPYPPYMITISTAISTATTTATS